MSAITLPKAIENFVAANNAHDVDALMATLAADAVVSDDGKTYTDDAGIRTWIGSHLIAPKIVITPTSFGNNRMVASSAGDFPGSPQPFAFNFIIEGDLVKGLSIDLA
ncbi:nuclear transport factor 2 family protein [Arthrobacter sp. MSA 4-2]|uniref:nuclear transport factor 2 family protein n=1 Tax=Arthrobacter sp. MSA 4-2 TaxID=2794349 RepID=UPI0018E8CAED|nr:nuclear transport factor 2 family protein [Arthrobacter sp. MSA 4-2]MBJ2120646.1 nuclear transport factor 2 family protein [Arthrobacter sp. MSA 4-2]